MNLVKKLWQVKKTLVIKNFELVSVSRTSKFNLCDLLVQQEKLFRDGGIFMILMRVMYIVRDVNNEKLGKRLVWNN